MGDSGRDRLDVAVLSFCESYIVVYLRALYISYLPIAVFYTYFSRLVSAKPSQNKLICLYILSVDAV